MAPIGCRSWTSCLMKSESCRSQSLWGKFSAARLRANWQFILFLTNKFICTHGCVISNPQRYVTECANDGTDMFSSHYVGMSAFKEHKQGSQDMSNKLNLTTNQIKSIQLMKGEILNLKETINQYFFKPQTFLGNLWILRNWRVTSRTWGLPCTGPKTGSWVACTRSSRRN